MVNKELIEYIEGNLRNNVSEEVIKNDLLHSGWQMQDIIEAFRLVKGGLSSNSAVSYSGSADSGQGEQVQANPLPGVFDLIDEAWLIYKIKIKLFLGILILPLLFSFVFGIISSFYASFVSLNNFIFGMILLVVLALIVGFILALGQFALIYAIKYRDKITVGEAYRAALPKIFSFFWISFLTGFIIWSGVFLFIIPAIIFSIWFSFSVFILADEDQKGMNALLRSKEYVKGLWWRVLWRYTAIGLIILSLGIILFIILGIPVGLVLASLELGPTTIELISTILQTGLSFFLTPFVVLYSFLLYTKVKEYKLGVFQEPNPKQKKWFILVGITGSVIGILLIALLFYRFFSLRNDFAYNNQVKFSTQKVRISLENYYSDNLSYPDRIEDLVPKYLEKIPFTKDDIVDYEPNNKSKGYELCVSSYAIYSSEPYCVGSDY